MARKTCDVGGAFISTLRYATTLMKRPAAYSAKTKPLYLTHQISGQKQVIEAFQHIATLHSPSETTTDLGDSIQNFSMSSNLNAVNVQPIASRAQAKHHYAEQEITDQDAS